MQMGTRNESDACLGRGDGPAVDGQGSAEACREESRPLADTRTDLDTRAQIHHMVVAFYRELVMDELLGPIFEEVAEVDWSEHIPQLIDYWCRVLLGDRSYRGAILATHRHVHDQLTFTAEHFDRWYGMFADTVDQRWAGPYADTAKAHAARIAASLARQLPRIAWEPTPSLEGSPIQFGLVAADG